MKKTNCNINYSAAWKRTARFSATLILVMISLAGPALSRGNDGGAGRPSSPAPTMINSSNAHVVVNFKAPGLTLSPTAASFSVITVGQSASTTITVTNKGLVSNTIKSDTVSGAGFSVSGLSLPLTLAALKSTTFKVTFNPVAEGLASGTATFSESSGASMSLSFQGTGGSGKISSSPSSASFGNVELGQTSDKVLTVTNSGNMAAKISTIAVSGAGFSSSGIAAGQTIDAGKSAALTVAFKPGVLGSASGSIVITGVSPLPALTIALSGAGVPVPAPKAVANPTSLSFGNVNVGSSGTQAVSVTNLGTANLVISTISSTSNAFSVSGISLPATLTPNQSVLFSTVFSPSTVGSFAGAMVISSNDPASPMDLTLSGAGVPVPAPKAVANPTSLSFGNVNVGSSGTQTVSVTNSGTANLVISTVTSSSNAFSISGISLPATLTPNQSAAFSVVFAPATAGLLSGALSVNSNDTASPAGIALSGTGVALTRHLEVNPSSLTFTNITVGENSSQPFTITNTGNGTATISAITASGTGYTVSGFSLPLTLPAGQSANVNVVFEPPASGTFTGSVSISSDADDAPVVALAGTAVQPPPDHLADLTWTPSTGDVVGYNVYRGSQSGGPYTLLNSSMIDATSYTDTTVLSGGTYYYIITSVDSSGNESLNSNETLAVIP